MACADVGTPAFRGNVPIYREPPNTPKPFTPRSCARRARHLAETVDVVEPCGRTDGLVGTAGAPGLPGVGGRCDARPVELRFSGEVVWWRGPAPHHFVALPEPEAARLRAVASRVTYGWGCIPATVTLGATTFTTSIFPKDGGFLVPVKAAPRRAEGVELGDDVALVVVVDDPDAPGGAAAEAEGRLSKAVRPALPHHGAADDDDYYDPAADPTARTPTVTG